MRRVDRNENSKLNHRVSVVARQFTAVIFCFIFALPQAALARTPQSSLSPAPKVTKQGNTLTHVVENRDDRGKVKTRISATGRLTEIKIDSHSSGTASSWEVTSGQTTVRASAPYRGQFSKIEVLNKKPKGILAVQMRLSADRRKYIVTSSQMRPYSVDLSQTRFNTLSVAPVCSDNSSAAQLAGVFSGAVNREVSALESQWACELKKRQWLFMDKSCESFDQEDRDKIIEGLAKVFASPATEASSNPRGLACLASHGMPEHSARVQAILLQNWNQAEQALASAGQPADGSDCTAIKVLGGRSTSDIDLPDGRLLSCNQNLADLSANGEYSNETGAITIARRADDYRPGVTAAAQGLRGYAAREAYASTIFHELVHASGFNSSNAAFPASETFVRNVEKCCSEPTGGGEHREAGASCAEVDSFVAEARTNPSGVVQGAMAADPVRLEYQRYEEMFSRLQHTSQRFESSRSANGATDYLLLKYQMNATYKENAPELLNSYFATLALNQQRLEQDFRTCMNGRTARAVEYQCAGRLSAFMRAINQRFFTQTCPTILAGKVANARSSCSQWIAPFNVMSDPNDVQQASGYARKEDVGYFVLAAMYGGRHGPSTDEVRARPTWGSEGSRQAARSFDIADDFASRAMALRTANVVTSGLRLAEIDRRPPDRLAPPIESSAEIPAPQIEVAQLAPLPPITAQAEVITPPAPRIAVTPLQIEQRIAPVQAQREVLQPATISEIITPLEVDQRFNVVTTAPRVVAPAAPAAEAEVGGSLAFGSAAVVAPRPAAAAAREVAPPPARSEVLLRSSDFDSPITMRESDLGSRAPSVSRGRYEPAASTERATAPVQALLSFADRVAQAALPQASANAQMGGAGMSGSARAPANTFDNPFAASPAANAQTAAPVAAAPASAVVALAPVVQDSNIGDLTRSNFSAARTQGAKPAPAGKSAPASASSAGATSRNAPASRSGAQASRENQEEDAPRRGGISPDAPARAVSVAPAKGAAAQTPDEDANAQASSGRGPARAGAPAARAARPRVYANENSLRSFLQSPDYSQVSSSLSTTALGVALIDYNYRITNEAGVTYGSQARDAKVLVYCHAQRRLLAPGACR